MNVTIPEEADSNKENLILFLYAASGRPNKTTITKTIQQGHFATRPGLTAKRVKKYIQGDIINIKGHNNLQRRVKNKMKKEIKEPNKSEDENRPKETVSNVEKYRSDVVKFLLKMH